MATFAPVESARESLHEFDRQQRLRMRCDAAVIRSKPLCCLPFPWLCCRFRCWSLNPSCSRRCCSCSGSWTLKCRGHDSSSEPAPRTCQHPSIPSTGPGETETRVAAHCCVGMTPSANTICHGAGRGRRILRGALVVVCFFGSRPRWDGTVGCGLEPPCRAYAVFAAFPTNGRAASANAGSSQP